MTINKAVAIQVLDEMKAAVEEIAKKHGLAFSVKSGKFTEEYLIGQFQFTTAAEGASGAANRRDNDAFVKTVKFGSIWGLSTSDIGAWKAIRHFREYIFKGMLNSKTVVIQDAKTNTMHKLPAAEFISLKRVDCVAA